MDFCVLSLDPMSEMIGTKKLISSDMLSLIEIKLKT